MCQGVGMNVVQTEFKNITNDFVKEKPSLTITMFNDKSVDLQEQAWQLEEFANAGSTILHLGPTYAAGEGDIWPHFRDGGVQIHHGRGDISCATNSDEVAELVGCRGG